MTHFCRPESSLTYICTTRLTIAFYTHHKDKLFSPNEADTERDMRNPKDKLTDELANLLNETAEAHHKAFAATDGEDAEWPI